MKKTKLALSQNHEWPLGMAARAAAAEGVGRAWVVGVGLFGGGVAVAGCVAVAVGGIGVGLAAGAVGVKIGAAVGDGLLVGEGTAVAVAEGVLIGDGVAVG